MRLVFGVDKVLDLSHAELPHPQKTVTRSNLIAESESYLSGGEGHPLLVVVEESLEVDEESLRSLGAKVAHGRSLGTDARLEHQVEGEGPREAVLGRG